MHWSPRGIVQWIKHSPATQAAGVRTQTQLKFKVLLSSRVPPPCALSLSHNACQHLLQREYLSQGRLKERNLGKNPSSTICEAKHSYKSHVWEKGG